MSKPSPEKIERALKDWGVDYQLMSGWDSAHIDPYPNSFNPVGIVLHHTAGVDSLKFCMTGSYPPVRNCHALVSRTGKVYMLAAAGCYHAGLGGPMTVDGTHIAKDMGNHALFGIEIESLGTSASVTDGPNDKKGMTPAQVEAVARLCNAYLQALGKPGHFDAVIRHRDWAPGRKIDVLQPLEFWRDEIKKVADSHKPVKPPVVVPEPPKPPVVLPTKPPVSTPVKPPVTPSKPVPPKIVVRLSKVQPGQENNFVLVVQKALKNEVGLDYSSGPGVFGPRTKDAYAKWQKKLGYKGKDADGVPGIQSLTALGKKYGFSVIE